MENFDLQLFGGGGGGRAPSVKQSAPGSVATATIDSATAGERQKVRDKLAKAKGRNFTTTGAGIRQDSILGSIKKALLGE